MNEEEDRRTGVDDRRDISRAEVWRLVDDNNRQWRDAHSRQTNAIDRLTASLDDRFNKIDARIAEHEEDDRALGMVVHDMLEREKTRMKRSAAAAGLVAMIVGPGAAVLFKKWFG